MERTCRNMAVFEKQRLWYLHSAYFFSSFFLHRNTYLKTLVFWGFFCFRIYDDGMMGFCVYAHARIQKFFPGGGGIRGIFKFARRGPRHIFRNFTM